MNDETTDTDQSIDDILYFIDDIPSATNDTAYINDPDEAAQLFLQLQEILRRYIDNTHDRTQHVYIASTPNGMLINGKSVTADDFSKITQLMHKLATNPQSHTFLQWISMNSPHFQGVSSNFPSEHLSRPPLSESATMPIRVRNHLVDIYDDQDIVSIVVELPGVDKSDIELFTLSATEIEIRTPTYQKTIKVPHEIEESGAKARYQNGILEISLHKRINTSVKRSITID